MASTLEKQIDLRRIGPSTYTVGWHIEWTLGSTLFGGSIAAIIYRTAATHLVTDATLAARHHPDILSLHIEFLNPCRRSQSTIDVTLLKVGSNTSTLQLQLSQSNQVKVVALVTATDFDKPVGPTVSNIAFNLLPPPNPIPDFGRVLAHQSDDHWLPAHLTGEIINIMRLFLILYPKGGFPVDGVCDAWYGCKQDDENMDGTFLAMMTDVIPSMSDTLLRNNGLYDAQALLRKMERWAEEHPSVPAELTTSVAEALRATVYNTTVTLDIHFKRRVPEDFRWVFTRVATRMLQGGRMDLDIIMCDSKMGLICTAQQTIFVLEADRKFRHRKEGPVL